MTRHETNLAAGVVLAALSAAACGGDGGSQTTVCMGTTIMAKDPSNYKFMSTLTFPPVKVKPATELTIDWSMATGDLQKHPVNVDTEVNLVMAMMWKLTLPELQTKLNADTAAQSDLEVLPLTFFPTSGGPKSAGLYSFTLNMNPITPAEIMPYFDPVMYPPANYTYTVMTATGTTLGQGIRMIQSFQLDPASTNTTVAVKADSTTINYTANLRSLQIQGVTPGTAAITLDWSEMTTNALGSPFILTNITEAMVGNFGQSLAELETKFLDLELIATQLYRAEITSGTVLDFTTLRDDFDQPFTGVTDTGTWVVALRCGGCRNPAPWYLTVLKPCTP
jgi:hypothetical protein